MNRPSIAVLLALTTANTARSQHMNEADSPGATVVSTRGDLTRCLARAEERAEAELNVTCRGVREKLRADDRQRLKSAQRLWIQYRDANCQTERELYAGGTAYSRAYLG